MQIVCNGDNLHEMSNPVFLEKWDKYNQFVINLSSAEFAERVVFLKQIPYFEPTLYNKTWVVLKQ